MVYMHILNRFYVKNDIPSHFSISEHFIFFLIALKELSFCHKLRFSNPGFFEPDVVDFLIFQTMNFVGSIRLSLKYQRFTPSDFEDIRIRKCEFVAKTQFLWRIYDFSYYVEWEISYSHFKHYITVKLLFLFYIKVSGFKSGICTERPISY